MRTAKTADNAATLRATTQKVNPGKQKSFRASKQPPRAVPPPPVPAVLAGHPARLINLRMYLADRFEEIIRRPDWGEAFGMIDDLEYMISHHPDLRPYARALRQMLAGWQVMAGLCVDIQDLTREH